MYNHNKAQQSKNRVHISWDILYVVSDYISELNSGEFRLQVNDGIWKFWYSFHLLFI